MKEAQKGSMAVERRKDASKLEDFIYKTTWSSE